MTEPARLPSTEDFAAALDWWRGAGVAHDFVDDATDWLAAPVEAAPARPTNEAVAAPPSPEPGPARTAPRPVENASPARFGGDEERWPADLAAFRDWWLSAPELEIGGTGPRIAPRGTARPKLMLLVAHPEQEDSDTLLSGAHGRLIAGFLRAAGIAAEQAYFASLLPRYMAAPDWERIGHAQCSAVLAHHIALVEPERIIVLGNNILPLTRHDTAQEGKPLPSFNHKARTFPCVESRGPALLLRSVAARVALWQSWLDGTDG